MGTTTFFPLDTPPSGGDTLYLSTTAAYYALSPIFREKLHSLSAIHSGVQQYNVTDGDKRHIRAPIETVHPVVRTHPVSISSPEPQFSSYSHKQGNENEFFIRQPPLHEENCRLEGRGEL
jgi:alpha-ketoglutarate-dependent taurine dioxygenase